MSTRIPATALQLRSLVTDDRTVRLFLETVEVPEPGPGQVLVRVEASPINPSDLGLLLAGADMSAATWSGPPGRPVVTAPLPEAAARAAQGRVGLPMPAGNEGAGTVVAAGSSPAAAALLGKTVAVAGGAMYAQYRCVDVALCLELPEGTRPADGASSFVNPMTALGMVETMRLENHPALVHTAAASNLGQMLNRLCLAGAGPARQHRAQARAGSAAEIGGRQPRVQLDVTGLHGGANRRADRDGRHAGLRRRSAAAALASQILTGMEAGRDARGRDVQPLRIGRPQAGLHLRRPGPGAD